MERGLEASPKLASNRSKFKKSAEGAGKSSNMQAWNTNSSSGMRNQAHSSMSRTIRSSMLQEAKTKKLPTFKYGRRMAQKLNHGNLHTQVT